MRRAVGLSVGAVVLSVTLGMLIGLVVHTGMQQRADSGPRPTTALTSEAGTTGISTVGVGVPAWSETITPITDPSSAGATNPGDPAASVAPPASAPLTTVVTVTTTPGLPATAAAGATSTATPPTPPATSVTSPPLSSTSPATRASRTTSPAGAPGHESAGGACRTLGAESAAGRTTLFCQHDPRDGALRWRAVIAGGGCLNQKMTGTGADGHRYACRRDAAKGLNYWRRID